MAQQVIQCKVQSVVASRPLFASTPPPLRTAPSHFARRSELGLTVNNIEAIRADVKTKMMR